MSDPILPIKCLIALTSKPTETPVWEDVSAYVRLIPQDIRRGRDRITTNFDAGDCKVILDNADRRFEPGYTGSPYYPYLKTTRRLRLALSSFLAASDSFNRADGAVGNADTGQTWVNVGQPGFAISSNRLRRNIANSGEGAMLLSTGSPAGLVQATFLTIYGSQSLIWRSSGGLDGYALMTRPSDHLRYQVKLWTGFNVASNPVLYDIAVTPAANDVVKVSAFGSTHRVYINGTLALTFTDSTYLTGTYWGVMKGQGAFAGGETQECFWDDFSVSGSTGGDIFDGYIESIECEYEQEMEGLALVTAVDGFKALNLMAPDRYSGIYDSFNRADGLAITKADSGQVWNAAAGTWATQGQMAQCDPASTLKESFIPGGRDTFLGTPVSDTDHTNHLDAAASGQTWLESTGGNWVIYGTGAGEDYAVVADWLTYRSFYETPALHADAAGFFRVGLDPGKTVTTYVARLTLGSTYISDNTGSMMGFYFLGDGGNNYWAFLFEDRYPLVGSAGYGCTLVRVVAGVPTFYRKYGDIWPGGPNNATYDSAFNFGGLGYSTTTVDVIVTVDQGNIKIVVVPVNGTLAQTSQAVQVAYKPTAGFLPGRECGLIHNGVSRVDATDHTTKVNVYKWQAITATGPGLLWLESGLSDGTVESLIRINDSRDASNGNLSNKGLLFRYSDDRNYWFALISPDGTGSPVWLRLWKVVDGSFTNVGSYQVASTFGSLTEYSGTDRTLNKLRVTLAGNSISVAWYGTTRITASDSFNAAATKHGLYHGNAYYDVGIQDESDWVITEGGSGSLQNRTHDDFRVGKSLSRQLSGERVDALLDVLGWPTADRSIATGTVYVAPLGSSLDIVGNTVLQHIRDAVEAEHGAFYFNASGVAVFEDRNTRLSRLTVAQTLEDTVYAGQTTIAYMPGVRLRLDDAALYNEVKITATISETKFWSGFLASGAIHGGYDTGSTSGQQTFTVRYVTRPITPVGAPYVYVKFYEGDTPWGPWTARTDLDSPHLSPSDEVDITVTGTTKRYKAFQLYWPSGGPPVVDLDVFMSSVPAEQTAIDAASIGDHYKRTFGPKTTINTSDADALALANLILTESREGQPRIERVRVAGDTPAIADSLIALDISTRVQVLKHFPDGSPYFSQIGFVEGLRYEFGDNQFFVTYSLSQQNAGLNAWILDDPILSVLDLTTRLT